MKKFKRSNKPEFSHACAGSPLCAAKVAAVVARRPWVRKEKDEQADIVRLLRSLGAAVYVSGTVRPRGDTPGTRQTPGIPDLEAFLPARGARRSRVLKVEVKRSVGGRLSREQAEYGARCLEADVPHVVGDLTAVMSWLVAEGYLRADQLPHDRRAETEAFAYPTEDMRRRARLDIARTGRRRP